MMQEGNPVVVEQPITQSKLVEFDPQNIDPQLLDQIIATYQKSYGDRWIGKERFIQETLPNTTAIDALIVGNQIAAAVNINTNRIITISVDTEFQGRGLGIELFKRVAELHPDIWISIGVDAKEMLTTITNKGLNFQLVEDPVKIEQLYRKIKGVPADFSIETTQIKDALLTSRCAKKGLKKEQFLAFTRSGSMHDSFYQQLLFQNQP